MLQSYKAPSGCTIFDLVLQCYLSLNLMPKFLIDNNIEDLNFLTVVGQVFVYDTDFVADDFMAMEILKNNYVFCTGKLLVTNIPAVRSNFLLIENGDILSTENNTLFII